MRVRSLGSGPGLAEGPGQNVLKSPHRPLTQWLPPRSRRAFLVGQDSRRLSSGNLGPQLAFQTVASFPGALSHRGSSVRRGEEPGRHSQPTQMRQRPAELPRASQALAEVMETKLTEAHGTPGEEAEVRKAVRLQETY